MTPMVWTLTDRHGRQWQAAVRVGRLRSDGLSVELGDAQSLDLKVTDMQVITLPISQGVDL